MKRDIYQEVTDQIIAELETGAAPWVRSWDASAGMPHNFTSHRQYTGINVMLLWAAGIQSGYSSSAWLTYKQAKDKGGHVRKGEKGTQIVFWKFLEKPTGETDANGDQVTDRIPMCRFYTVFNVEQCENLPGVVDEAPAVPQGYEHIDEVIQAIGADIQHGGNRACYIPSRDQIRMPRPQDFTAPANYYAVLMHELTHWTGAASRLDRNLSGRFGDAQYAAEELIAEIGAAFACARLGIKGELRHAAYIESWLKVLKNDKRAIFTAASQAQKAADYLIERAGGQADNVQEAA